MTIKELLRNLNTLSALQSWGAPQDLDYWSLRNQVWDALLEWYNTYALFDWRLEEQALSDGLDMWENNDWDAIGDRIRSIL